MFGKKKILSSNAGMQEINYARSHSEMYNLVYDFPQKYILRVQEAILILKKCTSFEMKLTFQVAAKSAYKEHKERDKKSIESVHDLANMEQVIAIIEKDVQDTLEAMLTDRNITSWKFCLKKLKSAHDAISLSQKYALNRLRIEMKTREISNSAFEFLVGKNEATEVFTELFEHCFEEDPTKEKIAIYLNSR